MENNENLKELQKKRENFAQNPKYIIALPQPNGKGIGGDNHHEEGQQNYLHPICLFLHFSIFLIWKIYTVRATKMWPD